MRGAIGASLHLAALLGAALGWCWIDRRVGLHPAFAVVLAYAAGLSWVLPRYELPAPPDLEQDETPEAR